MLRATAFCSALLMPMVFADSTVISVNGGFLRTNGGIFSGVAVVPPPVEGVNFADPLDYTKPYYIPIEKPNESSSPNKYWVDLDSGSGSTCSFASPCDSLADVCGKTTTGGAYVYIKGDGRIDLTSCALAGTSDIPLVFQPWPGDSTPANMEAGGGCTTNDANRLTATGMHHLIFDGGEDMLLRFSGSGCTSNQNGYGAIINLSNVLFSRVRFYGNNSSGPALGLNNGTSNTQTAFKMYNCEVYGANRYYGIYIGGGSSCPGGGNSFTDFEFVNNVFWGIDGRALQIEPRSNSSGVIIAGNAWHDTGYNNNCGCNISASIAPANACGATTTGILISNNIAFDLGGGFVVSDNMGSADTVVQVVGNTVYNYGNKSPQTANSHAFGCADGSGGCNATFYNNIALLPHGDAIPFRAVMNSVTDDNLCENGASNCGSGGISGTNAATAFVSSNNDTATFLFPKGPALAAATRRTGFSTDYVNASRNNPTSVGAIQ